MSENTSGASPQQRAAETRKDRAQLAAVARNVDHLLDDVIPMMQDVIALLKDDNARRARTALWRRPQLEVIINDEEPRPSRRKPPRLQLL